MRLRNAAKRLTSLILPASIVFSCAGIFCINNFVKTGFATTNNGVVIDEENFPDSRFRRVVSDSFDKNKDKMLDEAEIANAVELKAPGSIIEDIKGIEFLVNLKNIDLERNFIRVVDLSNNPEVEKLNIIINNLNYVDVSNCSELVELDVTHNDQLKFLDVTHNRKLRKLNISNVSRDFKHIDLSQNPELRTLYADHIGLSHIDLSHNTKLEYYETTDNSLRFNRRALKLADLPYDFKASSVEGLYGAKIKDGAIVLNEGANSIDYQYVTGGNKRRTFYFSGYYVKPIPVAEINSENFPDENLRKLVAESYDQNKDGILDQLEVDQAIFMDLSGRGIKNIKGIEFLNKLVLVDLSNNQLSSISLPRHYNLSKFNIANNKFIVHKKTIPASDFPGDFDMSKISNLQGAVLKDGTIEVGDSNQFTFDYATDNRYFPSVSFSALVEEGAPKPEGNNGGGSSDDLDAANPETHDDALVAVVVSLGAFAGLAFVLRRNRR